MICNSIAECIEMQLSGNIKVKCPNDIDMCVQSSDKRSKVKCEEKRKKYILNNTQKNHIIAYKMDGGIISEDKSVPNETGKCDFMLVINGEEKTAILVELKGVDVGHGLNQIIETINRYDSFLKTISHVYARLVVRSSAPQIKATPSYVNLTKLIYARNGNVKIFEMQIEEKDTDLECP